MVETKTELKEEGKKHLSRFNLPNVIYIQSVNRKTIIEWKNYHQDFKTSTSLHCLKYELFELVKSGYCFLSSRRTVEQRQAARSLSAHSKAPERRCRHEQHSLPNDFVSVFRLPPSTKCVSILLQSDGPGAQTRWPLLVLCHLMLLLRPTMQKAPDAFFCLCFFLLTCLLVFTAFLFNKLHQKGSCFLFYAGCLEIIKINIKKVSLTFVLLSRRGLSVALRHGS